MTHNICPLCVTPMAVTDRHARGCNSTGAAGGRIEPVHGFVVRGQCQDPECGANWVCTDCDPAWRRCR